MSCVQLPASVLGMRATRLCVCLQETGSEAAKEKLQFPMVADGCEGVFV